MAALSLAVLSASPRQCHYNSSWLASRARRHAVRSAKNAPRAFFLDLGVEIGQSALLALGEGYESACRYAHGDPQHYTAEPFDGAHEDVWHATCLQQNRAASKILSKVQRLALARNTDLLHNGYIIMIEPNAQSNPILDAIVQQYPNRATAMRQSAATAGREGPRWFLPSAKSTSADLVNVPRLRRLAYNRSARLADDFDKEFQPASGVNILRILAERVHRRDFVVLKVDIEGAEYDLLACLLRSPVAALIDVVLLERHEWRGKGLRVPRDKVVKLTRALAFFESKNGTVLSWV